MWHSNNQHGLKYPSLKIVLNSLDLRTSSQLSMASCHRCSLSLQAAVLRTQLRAVDSSFFCALSSSRALPHTSKYLRHITEEKYCLGVLWDLNAMFYITVNRQVADWHAHLRALEYFFIAACQFWALKKLFPIFLMSSDTDRTLSAWKKTSLIVVCML